MSASPHHSRTTSIVFLNGKFVPADQANISVFDHGFLYGDGVYETLRTYGGKVWQLSAHLRRLSRSARFLGLKFPYPASKIAHFVRETVRRNGFPESRIRITLTRGINQYDFTTCHQPTLCIQVQKLVPESREVYEKGVKVVTFQGPRYLPEAKTISLLPMIAANRFMKKKKAYEALLIDDKGYVLEGTVTNVFMVKDGVLMTPCGGMLAGTTRQFLLKLARREGFKVLEKSLNVKAFFQADEIFLTNAPRGIIPVIRVDGRKIGTGKPGPMTRKMMSLLSESI